MALHACPRAPGATGTAEDGAVRTREGHVGEQTPRGESWGQRVYRLLLKLYGPANLGRDLPPTERQAALSDASRREQAAAWDVATDANGRRYIVARRGGPEDRAEGAAPAGEREDGRGTPERG